MLYASLKNSPPGFSLMMKYFNFILHEMFVNSDIYFLELHNLPIKTHAITTTMVWGQNGFNIMRLFQCGCLFYFWHKSFDRKITLSVEICVLLILFSCWFAARNLIYGKQQPPKVSFIWMWSRRSSLLWFNSSTTHFLYRVQYMKMWNGHLDLINSIFTLIIERKCCHMLIHFVK